MEAPQQLLGISQAAKKWQIKELNLSYEGAVEIPPEFFELNQLEILDLRDNNISSLSESISQLTNLVALDLGNNKLMALPESLSQLTNLTTLDLRHNQLTR